MTKKKQNSNKRINCRIATMTIPNTSRNNIHSIYIYELWRNDTTGYPSIHSFSYMSLSLSLRVYFWRDFYFLLCQNNTYPYIDIKASIVISGFAAAAS